MTLRRLRLAAVWLVALAVVLMPGRTWAVFFPLGPAEDEWGLKYAVKVDVAEGGKLNVHFTLADQGRLKPIYSATVVAFSDPNPDGGRTYLLKSQINLQTTEDGHLAGQVQIPSALASRASIRILTLTFDGRRQTAGARYYQIPLQKYLPTGTVASTPRATPSLASPPQGDVSR